MPERDQMRVLTVVIEHKKRVVKSGSDVCMDILESLSSDL